jgi:alpha-mannosidase
VYDSERGLAVVSFGLLESAVRDLPERPIALTLLRGTRRTVMTDGEPEGQLLGAMNFRYWIVPLQGTPDRVRLCLLGQQLAAGLRAAQLRPADVALERQEATLAPEAGMLSLEGQAVLTSMRRVSASLEVRLFNPSEQPSLVKLDISGWPASQQPPTHGRPVDLESKPLGDSIAFQDGILRVPLAPKQIVTLSLT